MPEMADAGEDHRGAPLIGERNHLGVALGAAWLDRGGDTGG